MMEGLGDDFTTTKSILEDAEPKRRKQTLPSKKKQNKLSHVEMKMIKSILPNNIKNNIVII